MLFVIITIFPLALLDPGRHAIIQSHKKVSQEVSSGSYIFWVAVALVWYYGSMRHRHLLARLEKMNPITMNDLGLASWSKVHTVDASR